jgi:hypothetical protein
MCCLFGKGMVCRGRKLLGWGGGGCHTHNGLASPKPHWEHGAERRSMWTTLWPSPRRVVPAGEEG